MEETSYKCDGCGKPKEQSNHWWRLGLVEGLLLLGPWDKAGAMPKEHFHLCGAACVAKKVSEFVGGKAR